MSIRKFQSKDLTQIMEIWLEGNLDAHDFISENYWKSHYENVKESICQAEILVDEENEVIRGFLGIQGTYVAGVFVKRDFRAMGIGRCLMETVKQDHVQLEVSVYERNSAALRFYLREGFKKVHVSREEETGEIEFLLRWSRDEIKR